MTIVHRVLAPVPVPDLAGYLKRRGGRGLENARSVDPAAIIDEVEASGLRGRGGGGFPTATKWRTVVANRSDLMRTSIVVNGAEGEPGTFKDRTILDLNPYLVIEGVLIAALAVSADLVIFGLKQSSGPILARVRRAIDEVVAAGWADGVELDVYEGPSEYLYGEETALLETIDGRYPFPRLAPPFRRGVREMVEHPSDLATGSGLSAHVTMAGSSAEAEAAPTLVNNVETFANLPGILARGASWYRTEGTEKSPGTVVCTVTGAVEHAGVGEVIMGTPLREVIEAIGGRITTGSIRGVISGVANAYLTADQLDVPVSYEGLAAEGSGLGSAGFRVLGPDDDPVAYTAGVSRFLAVESCGQCTPCKHDGLQISTILDRLVRNQATERDLANLEHRLDTVAIGARCYLATQHEVVVRSLLATFGDEVSAHLGESVPPTTPVAVAELRSIDGGKEIVDTHHAQKQPDWTFDPVDSGQSPAARLGDHREPQQLED